MIWEMPAVISIAAALLAVTALLEIKDLRPRLRPEIRKNLQARKYWLWLTVPFFLVLISAPYTSDLEYLSERLRIKLPFILLPFAFAALPALRKKELQIIGIFFVLTLTVAAVWVLQNYYFNYTEINDAINRGKAMPTPSSHIRFSLATAGGVFCALFLGWQKEILGTKKLKFPALTCGVFLFIFLHILSVRSGLLAFYAAAGVLTLQYIYQSGNLKIGVVTLVLLVSVPIAAVKFLPSLSNKIGYTYHDLRHSLAGKGQNFSDGERWISLRAAKEIIEENPILGTGAGDLKQEMRRVYVRQKQNLVTEKMPHSQLVSVTAGTGLVGLLLFLLGFFAPLFKSKNYHNYLFTAWHVIIFTSFLSENTFETNYGVSLWLTGVLVGLSYLSGNVQEKSIVRQK